MGSQAQPTGPDLADGIDEAQLGSDPLLAQLDGEAIVLVRDAGCVHAFAASCTHYGGPLAEGIIADGKVHCPWHHAAFDLATGRPDGPAIAPLACWDVTVADGRIRVGKQKEIVPPVFAEPARVVIIGAGAAGIACAEALRLEGHRGSITIVSGEPTEPVDRPNLSKDTLAGSAPEEWAFLRTKDALHEHHIRLVAGTATAIDTVVQEVRVGESVHPWDALLIATGAEPVRLPIPGAELPHVHTLRTLADTRAIAAAATAGRDVPVVVIGASFIGLEAAAALRARGAEVTVVGPETIPLARVLGDEVGSFVRAVHEEKGVVFRLGWKPAAITADHVVLDDGSTLPAALVVMGVGVRPRTDLAAAVGLTIDRGVVVDESFRAAPGIWAAGDIARYPLWDGERVRIEHWQVAVRHGQAVARAMLGQRVRSSVPFFWSQHHDVTLGYVGHAEQFDVPEVKGDLAARDAHVVYRHAGKVRAVVTIGRDRLALQVEAAMERGDHAAVDALVG
jgi:NADPH-dependent 2,4-dienoyl-CoA reductase/sulfur reductase-like enzyme/nitrite reductase/ring-hydroxylating ferredoxin subunit